MSREAMTLSICQLDVFSEIAMFPYSSFLGYPGTFRNHPSSPIKPKPSSDLPKWKFGSSLIQMKFLLLSFNNLAII